ncbi:hypothetical protein BURKHO8Y_210286 [Burkholderia sp. 8Y]|nr:hypothetical protein BURKHO8Y_210286 [Burkholderia sp. 8Y]
MTVGSFPEITNGTNVKEDEGNRDGIRRRWVAVFASRWLALCGRKGTFGAQGAIVGRGTT